MIYAEFRVGLSSGSELKFSAFRLEKASTVAAAERARGETPNRQYVHV